MGLFFKTKKEKNYIHLKRRKFTSSIGTVAVIGYFILIPLIYSFIRTNFVIIAIVAFLFLCAIYGIWIGIEGIYYGFFLPRKYEKQGKKVDRKSGEGIKIYI
jgi:hypothetical protein